MSNLITKGLSKVRQTLVVWGLLGGEVTGGGSGPGSLQAYYDYLSIRKVNDLSESVNVFGSKRFSFGNRLNLAGARFTNTSKATLATGSRSLPISNLVAVSGSRSSDTVFENRVFGSSQFDISQSASLHGFRFTGLHDDINVAGSRITDLDESKTVLGRRDLTPILVAVNLI